MGRRVKKRFVYDPALGKCVERAPRRIRKRINAGWPQHCETMAVDPRDIGSAVESDRAVGAPRTEYDRQGCPVFTSARHQAAWAKAHGGCNRDGVLG